MSFLEHSNAAEHPAVTIVSTDVGSTVADLRGQAGRDIWLFGGGNLFGSLLAAGLVDQIEIAVMPVVLGGGVPRRCSGAPVPSSLTRSARSPAGIVNLQYDVQLAAR